MGRGAIAVVMLALVTGCAPVAAPPQNMAANARADAARIAQEIINTERAYAESARRDGQWTAFRAYAAPDAVMFVPGPTPADQWLAGKADPPQSADWQPHRVIVSCDGTLAVSTGAAQFAGGLNGVYVTIWARQADGSWRWIADDGGTVERALSAPAAPAVEVAECPGSEGPEPQGFVPTSEARGASRDATLLWDWREGPSPGLRVTMWIGTRFAPTILPGSPQP